jgi:arylsulfatase A
MMKEISRRDFLKTSAALGASTALPALLMSGCSGQSTRPDITTRPNIVLIMADDLGYECIGANGGTSYKTPVLDRLAVEGIRFEHCYSQPLCTPSRVEIMTGMYNVRNYVKFGLLDDRQTTFAHLLKKAGYSTCISGKWQLGRDRKLIKHFGFDEYCLWWLENKGQRYGNVGELIRNDELLPGGKGEYGPDVVSAFTLDFITRHRNEPFFCYYPMILPHSPFLPTPDSKDQSSTDIKSNFTDMVAYMDKIVGEIDQHLTELELRENTLLIFTGDNGTDNRIRSMMDDRVVTGDKGSMTDAGTRVPLIANWPGVIPGKQVSHDLIDFSDFLPTLCDVADLEIPSTLNIDGRSFLPQLQGKKGNPREWIYSWFSAAGGTTGSEWARNQRYKLYRSGNFYDVSKDPMEKNPLTDLSPEAQRIRAELLDALEKYNDARPAEIAAQGKKIKKHQTETNKALHNDAVNREL